MKCPICGKDFPKGWRSVHGHMLKDHTVEYRAKGCRPEAFGISTKISGEPPAQKQKQQKPAQKQLDKPPKRREPPDDFRVLDRTDTAEAEAYTEGYRYYSGGNAFTADECRERGWI